MSAERPDPQDTLVNFTPGKHPEQTVSSKRSFLGVNPEQRQTMAITLSIGAALLATAVVSPFIGNNRKKDQITGGSTPSTTTEMFISPSASTALVIEKPNIPVVPTLSGSTNQPIPPLKSSVGQQRHPTKTPGKMPASPIIRETPF